MGNIDMGEVLAAYEEVENATKRAQSARAQQGSEGNSDAPQRRLYLTPFEDIDARDIEPMRWLVDAHLPAGEATLLYAPQRSYKSFLAMEYGLAVALGKPFLGRQEAQQGVVFYLDLENPVERFRERVRASLRRDNIARDALRGKLLMHDRRPDLPSWRMDEGALEELGDYVEGLAPALVIVDNMRKGLPFGVEENSNSEINPIVNRLLAACERGGAALLLVHHTNRGNERYSGAGALGGSVANEMIIAREPGTRKALVTSVNMRNAEEFAPYTVEMGEDVALRLVDEPAGGGDAYARVSECVRKGPRTVDEIAEFLGVSRTMADRHVKGMAARGALVAVAARDTGGKRAAQTYGLPVREFWP